MNTPGSPPDAKQAALELSEVLAENAAALASDDLATVAAAMTRVRAGARALEAGLTSRGWGGDVLYGWGEPDEDELEDRWPETVDDDESDGAVIPSDGPFLPSSALKMTYQCRADFYLTDEQALIDWIVEHAGDWGLHGWDRPYVESRGAFDCFTDLVSQPRLDLTDTGLLPAGSQAVTYQVDRTLWEMHEDDVDTAGDAFPVNG
ncbi:hypothetical protein FHX74_001641 [Friedmanniella endophytica]|uniref:Uncharacterized protein n=1 Tax=Microlunatus kandeliicorticis TaxID=1759536 RepID=A0A7W3IRQ1_9ACTN|nr:hypothetical protein [Microlunatus kandeliicorticis]MBA8794036.1 hypothetical protein [Microlunatus kandeliicorticis]